MNCFAHLFDAKHELLVKRSSRGIKLLRPDAVENTGGLLTLEQMFDLPVNVFMVSKDSIIEALNEHTVSTAGFRSVRHALGQTTLVAATRECAEFEFRHDRSVYYSRQMKIEDELYVRKDGISWTSLAIKFPWYHEDNLIGVFGCTVILDKPYAESLAKNMSLLISAGLLSPSRPDIYQDNPAVLTRREKQVLKLVGTGKTVREIAFYLSLSKRTVEHHVENLKEKLNARYKTDLVAIAQAYNE